MILLGAAAAEAEMVRMRHGFVFKVVSYERLGSTIRLGLSNGGEMTVSAALVEQVLPSEDPAGAVEKNSAGKRGSAPASVEILKNSLAALAIDPSHTLSMVPYRLEISQAARRYAINPLIVAAIISATTDYQEQAFSTEEGRGLMLVRPEVAEEAGVDVDDLFDPEQNLEVGTRYLSQLAQAFPDDPLKVLAAYKAGGRGIGEWEGGLPADPELHNFILRVCAELEQMIFI